MAATVEDWHDDVVVGALHELRETRRRRRLGDWNVIDALYKAYLAAVVGGVGVTLLSGVVGDQRLQGQAVADVRRYGAAWIGLVVAGAIALGLRSGARGGPLALEAAEVRYVLLAPVDRDIALQAPARRQLRFTAFAGTVTGAAAGLLAFRRLPGQPVEWIAAGALVGGATAIAMGGAAMVASGRRLGKRTATALAIAVIGWSVADVVAGMATSPASLVGKVGLWPLHFQPLAAAGLIAAPVLAIAGLRSVGGLSLEAAERRGRLVTHLRFAATFQDLRTVMLLRRQLSAEQPRSRPWMKPKPAGLGRVQRNLVVWRRDWRGVLRWPAVRIARLTILGAVAGLATAAAWAGNTAMIAVAGVAMFVAGLDAIEGLSQEIDHPDRRDGFPAEPSAIHLRHLAVPTVVLTFVALAGVAAAAAASHTLLALKIGLPLAIPAAATAAGAAAVSALRAPPDPSRLMADSTGMGLLFHHALPPGLAIAAPAAVLLAHSQLKAEPGADPIAIAVSAAFNILLLAGLIFGWVRQREAVSAFFAGGR
ncbi:MAG: hypothetical protein QOF60_3149 [Actinomycetota bacterium]|nr:hypothetical protein [Actinomycetota bacterium]